MDPLLTRRHRRRRTTDCAGRPSRAGLITLVGVVALIGSAGCAGGPPSAEPTPTSATARASTADPTVDAPVDTTVGTTADRVRWSPCGPLECARIDVPLDHDHPDDGRTVALALARRPATDPDHRLGVLLVNPGGPGASGIDYLPQLNAGPLGERFDLVSWDPRGVGASDPLDCDGPETDRFRQVDSDPDSPAEQTQLEDAARAVAEACRARAPDRLAHLRTTDTVRDLDLIRQALGEDQISFLGFSYGTTIGQRYAEQYGPHVRAMVLDGVVDPSEDLAKMLAGQAEAIRKSLDQALQGCADSPSCPLADPSTGLVRIAHRLEQSPLAGPDGTRVGPSQLSLAAVASSYSPTGGDRLVAALAQADQGSGSGLAALVSSYTASGSLAAYLAVTCTDSPHPDLAGFRDLARRLETEAPIVGAAVANELLPCAMWPAPAGPASPRVRAPEAPPILVVGNTGDAATPYGDAVAVTADLADGHLLTFRGRGHTSFGQSRCVRDAVTAYLTDLTLPAEGTTCES